MTSADEILHGLLDEDAYPHAAILDSCGVGHLGSHLMIAGAVPVEVSELKNEAVEDTLRFLDEKLSGKRAAIFTLSYEFGARMQGIDNAGDGHEPDVYLALFDKLDIHDYKSEPPASAGGQSVAPEAPRMPTDWPPTNAGGSDYFDAVEQIEELIRDGRTYQTNLTHRITVALPDDTTSEKVFARLRRDHPAPFAAFIRRGNSTVVSASPERFFRINGRAISTSPIKGTRPRGTTKEEDDALRSELINSEKDRAENTMIVDLLRNDLGRVCEYGSVEVEKLCDLEEHPTLFHLVSTISGRLRDDAKFSDVLRSLFPCGSITGAPKISTMKIIDRIERSPRGLSMGAIGYYIPKSMSEEFAGVDLSVAIRTMVVRGKTATFNVGGGITIDSDPEAEWQETWTKAKVLMSALDAPDWRGEHPARPS